MSNKFEAFLNQFDEKAWLETVSELLPEIHEVDRNAVQIWFRFYPLALFRYLQAVENKEEAIQKFVLQGKYELKDQIDESHKFLYGHRFWRETKAAVFNHAESFHTENADLKTEVRAIARAVAKSAKTTECLAVGIVLTGLMTLVQVGFDAFKAAEGKVFVDDRQAKKSAKEILAERARDDSQGLFGFLKTIDKKFSVNYDETDGKARFKIIYDEELATAAAKDQSRDWKAMDERRWEGVIPVECRSAACGTCWVGVLGGQEKLSEVSRLERKQIKVFGYNQPEDEKPFLRLACQAKAYGNATIVIPPWNGVFGKKIYGNVEETELEPATTSAKANRTVVKEATKNQLM
ncbi:MAG TPA: 2Fe-2S iron-sulfur cluster-binding protein [Pyrinomonadaceae bacterium]|nr:2Fe-2S iron-sulfur cluster-binding protein [Pyrinomonadaceae bacterium]